MLDTFALVRAGRCDPTALIKLLAAYSDETSSPVWAALSQVLLGLDKVMMGSGLAMHAAFVTFAGSLVAPAVARVGWEPAVADEHRTRLLRVTLLGLAGRFVSEASFVEGAFLGTAIMDFSNFNIALTPSFG